MITHILVLTNPGICIFSRNAAIRIDTTTSDHSHKLIRSHKITSAHTELERLPLSHMPTYNQRYIYLVSLAQISSQLIRYLYIYIYIYRDSSKNLHYNFLFLSIFFSKEFRFFFIYFSFIFSEYIGIYIHIYIYIYILI